MIAAAPEQLRAYRTRLLGIDGVVRAASRSKARYAPLRAAWEAGYAVRFTERVAVRRYGKYDQRQDLLKGRCYALDFVEAT